MSDTLDLPLCQWCEEPCVDGEEIRAIECSEDGQTFATVRARHHECSVRAVVGSVGHQRRLCSCNGGPGTMDDPPGLTRRQAAQEALREAILGGLV